MHLFLYLLTAGILVWSALYGKRPGWIVIALLVAIQAIIWIFCHTGRKKDNLSRRKKFGFSKVQGIPVGISVFLIFSLSLAIVLFRPVLFYDLVYQAEGGVVRTFRKITGSGREPVAEGTVSRGNNYRSGITQLEVTASEMPGEELYLKGFCGGTYADSHWEEADEETVLREASQTMGWDDWYSMVEGMHYTMYFMLNRGTIREDARSPIVLEIEHRNGDYSTTFMPYYSRSGRIGQTEEETKTDGYVYQYYELTNIDIAWDERSDVREKVREWYRWLQAAYAEKAQEVFTQIPEDQLPGLTQLVAENPQKDLGGITAFICHLLQEQTDYTLTPGRAPVNRDIVEYFLFENRQGYCQHYASAAVLLYRLYGIPARYVSGYRIHPSDFEEQEDGTWKAEVTDLSAHAWVEILLEDYGWLPVEVTPAADGSISMPFQEYDSAALVRIAEGANETIRFGEWEESGQGRTEKKSEEGYSYLFDLERYREVYLVLGACFLCGMLFTPVLLDYRRLRRRQQMERMGCRKIFAVMMEMLHYAGYFLNLEGWEGDFPRNVSKEFPQVAEEEIRRLQDIVKEDAYGQVGADAEKEQFVRWIYFRLVEQVFQRMKGFKKLIFRYGKRFG